MPAVGDGAGIPILDCHQHFFDARRFRYPPFIQHSSGFAALVGDYSALPRVYLPDDYARDTAGLNVVKTVWAEFVSDDPVGEVRWAQAQSTGRPDGMIGVVDFRDPGLDGVLNDYAASGRVRCVRQHLGWHPTNPALRMAPHPDVMSDLRWRRGVAAASRHGLVCEIEVFSSQLVELASVAAACPEVTFVLPVMGWPIDITSDGHAAWQRGMASVAACPNVAVKIFGMECIFGVHWTVPQVRPWILETIALFGRDRCMFASHMPISLLARSFAGIYGAYLEVIADFSVPDKRRLLHDTAAAIYGL